MKNEQIQNINQHISDALDQWQNIMLTADAEQWACELNYTDKDLLHSLYIFNHVAQNIGIKNGTLEKIIPVEIAAEQLRLAVKFLTGKDSRELVDQCYNTNPCDNDQ